MDETSNNLMESPNKRSRSDEDIKTDKEETSSSADSGQQSPHEQHKQQGEQEQILGSSKKKPYIHLNSNSDSGLSLKMEESSCGTAEVTEENSGTAKCDNIADDDDNTMADVPTAEEPDIDDQQMSTNDSVTKNEEVGTDKTNVKDNDTANSTTGDIECPATSSSNTHINRHKRNSSRNYRTSGRSSSSSSESSIQNHNEGQNEAAGIQEQQQQGDSQESSNSSAETSSHANDSEQEEGSAHSMRYDMFVPFVHDSSESDSSSSATSFHTDYDDYIDDVDDESDFEAAFADEYNLDNMHNSSRHSRRIKEKDEEVNKVLNKQKPPYNWSASYELMRREHGLSSDGKRSLPNGWSPGFKNRFYASRHVVERMEISHVLRKHSGCVNCLNFNKSGDLLVTGSDDARLIVWDWAANKTKCVWKSGHSANIFQSKFLPLSSCIDVISAGRDGKVRHSMVPPSGGKVQVSHLYLHSGAVHKLVICPDNPSQVISVGEDGLICSKDLREDNPKVDLLKVFSTTRRTRKVRLFSISHHPFAPEICVSGSDQYVRVYDKRSMKDTVHLMSPEHILETNAPNVTCCVYNNTGTEILATYSEDNIYLFDNKKYIPGNYLHSYKGHYNQKTIKGVNFFGPNSEYVISGSDCSNIFFWDKNTEAILHFMPGDTTGVVNCLEPHPTTPILATSGLDHNVKIWTPSAEKYPPDLTRLTGCVRRNLRRTLITDSMDLDSDHWQFLIQQMLGRRRHRRRHPLNDSADEPSNASGIENSDSERQPNNNGSNNNGNNNDNEEDENEDDHDIDDDDDYDEMGDLRHISCRTQ